LAPRVLAGAAPRLPLGTAHLAPRGQRVPHAAGALGAPLSGPRSCAPWRVRSAPAFARRPSGAAHWRAGGGVRGSSDFHETNGTARGSLTGNGNGAGRRGRGGTLHAEQ